MDNEFVVRMSRMIIAVIFAICTAYIICYVFFAQYLQQGFSMAPEINDRNVVIVNRLYKKILPLKRRDMIIFWTNNGESIKRIYGLPGEVVRLEDGDIYINDEKIENNNLKNSLSSNIEQVVQLDKDEYYVLGDNLDSSNDSRFSDFGNVKKDYIIGKVWYVIK